ncbi:A-kinase-interacting protein 1 isoform X1 [Clupea harengus]|uniref:A-kinase-interacting protein 1 isoform X1 n=1 Tax=Clupea harengus TaxID=7950 RepID=A0A8M1KJH3_CLUHA|nr:A-kinase-interacting protein 1 isoform X1 [Clupea harengus]
MTSHSWLESSLHRSSKLGREVLERARKRSVRWSNTSPYGSRTSLESTGDIHQLDVKKIQEDPVNLHKSLDNAFDRVVEFMDHTSYECKNFYKSVPDPSDDDREHICRFHSGRPARPSPPPPSTCGRKRSPVPVKDSVKVCSMLFLVHCMHQCFGSTEDASNLCVFIIISPPFLFCVLYKPVPLFTL